MGSFSCKVEQPAEKMNEEIVSKLMKENHDFRKASEIHSDCEQQLEQLSKKHFLSDEEKLIENSLKKKKLAAKDRLISIIQTYQQ